MKKFLRVLLIVIITLSIVGGIGYSLYYFFFMPNNKVLPAFNEGELYLIIEGDIINGKASPKIVDGEILLPFDILKKYIDEDIYWDNNEKRVTVTTKDRVIRMKTDNLDALVNDKPMMLDIPVTVEEGTVFIPIEFLKDFYNIKIEYLEDNNVIIIDFLNSIIREAVPIDSEAVIRNGHSKRNPILRTFDAEESIQDHKLRIFEEYNNWYKVRAEDGTVGFIEKRFVVVKRIYFSKLPVEDEETAAWEPANGKINLVWEQVYNNRVDVSKINKMNGLDVVSPTWFEVKDEKGNLINRGDMKYVEWAHKNGYKVWALLANTFSDSSITTKLLNSTEARENLIRELLAYSSLYKIDGINIDFENVNKDDKEALTQFVREATPLLREQGLVVSMDINLHAVYDRKAIGETVDYVMLMAYDQHWRGGGKAGSVAQLTWVEDIVNEFLETIPKEKFVLGLPFYTRLWTEEDSGDGAISLTSKALSMEDISNIIIDKNGEVIWDEESGQYYGEFSEGKSVSKVWIENEDSINLKSSLAHKYKLAGTAAWSRNFASPQVWEVLNNNLKEIKSYNEWKLENSNIPQAH